MPNDDTARFSLYIPRDLLERLREDAEREKRSLNAHLLYIIEQYLKRPGRK